MHENPQPTEFDQAVRKLEAYNNGEHLQQATEQEVATGGLRHLKRFGAIALAVAVSAVGGAWAGNQMTEHSSVRNYDQALEQTQRTPGPGQVEGGVPIKPDQLK